VGSRGYAIDGQAEAETEIVRGSLCWHAEVCVRSLEFIGSFHISRRNYCQFTHFGGHSGLRWCSCTYSREFKHFGIVWGRFYIQKNSGL
jgi:hypothetical protein